MQVDYARPPPPSKKPKTNRKQFESQKLELLICLLVLLSILSITDHEVVDLRVLLQSVYPTVTLGKASS